MESFEDEEVKGLLSSNVPRTTSAAPRHCLGGEKVSIAAILNVASTHQSIVEKRKPKNTRFARNKYLLLDEINKNSLKIHEKFVIMDEKKKRIRRASTKEHLLGFNDKDMY